MFGHYPEGRSGNKGNEPENCAVGEFGGVLHLFVNSERANVVFVYDISDVTAPVFKQVLPVSTVGPEGLVAVPIRDLVIVANEVDERDNKIRSSLTIYMLSDEDPKYPTLVSADREGGTLIPFSALSGLCAGDPMGQPAVPSRRQVDERVLYTIEDSAYKKSRMFKIDVSEFPYEITEETRIMDTNGILKNALTTMVEAGDLEETVIVDDIVNEDMTINIDPEGVTVSYKGGFWIASEGSGTFGDAARPILHPNMLLKVETTGIISQAVFLPKEVNDIQLRFGFEGVAEQGDYVVVAHQRAWNGEDHPRLSIYNQLTKEWMFVHYPLDAVESQYGGWVGLSDITPLGDGKFLVLERDNQGKFQHAQESGRCHHRSGPFLTSMSFLFPLYRWPRCRRQAHLQDRPWRFFHGIRCSCCKDPLP